MSRNYKFDYPDMRRTSDVDIPFTKVNNSNDYSACPVIFKVVFSSMANQIDGNQMQKSAGIVGNTQADVLEQCIINIYPNPAKDNLTVTSNQSMQSIVLYNSTGKMILDFSNLNTIKHTFNLLTLKPGLYIVKTTTVNGYEKVQKIIKK